MVWESHLIGKRKKDLTSDLDEILSSWLALPEGISMAGASSVAPASHSLSMASRGHRIIELFALEETFKVIESNILVISQ